MAVDAFSFFSDFEFYFINLETNNNKCSLYMSEEANFNPIAKTRNKDFISILGTVL